MGLTSIFGINGIGKDTVANEIKKENIGLKVTSMSRIYMYILGISKSCSVSEKISEEQYRQLENISQEKMKKIEDNEYRKILERMANSKENIIFLGHLISALRLGDETVYLEDRKIPDWFVGLNDNLIQLVAPAEIISERRKSDLGRKRNYEIDDILKHQSLCSEEWNRILQLDKDNFKKMHIVENIKLSDTVEKIENIIFSKNKEDMFEEYDDGR